MENSITKTCEKCQQTFECCANDIKQCFCYQIKLSVQEIALLKENFKNCLCEKCLREHNNFLLTDN